jgi:hypothetical protein
MHEKLYCEFKYHRKREFKMIVNRLMLKTFILMSFVLIMVVACDNTQQPDTVSHNGKNMQVNLTLPQSLAAAAIADLLAYATVDGGARHKLTVDPITNTVSGEIPGVEAGTHELKIIYYVIRSQLETMLATVTKTVSVSSGKRTPVDVADDDLDRNIDTDGDGFTNLAEVRSGTNPHDDAETPGTPPMFAVGHGSYGDTTSQNYALKSIVGETMVGPAASTNYSVTTGFTNY